MDEFETRLDFGTRLVNRDLMDGIITVEGPINTGYVMALAREIREVKRLGGKPLSIHLLSGGGGVYPATSLYDTLRRYSETVAPVTITVMGVAASAASMIVLQAADPMRRLATPNSRLMVHEVRSWYQFGIEKAMSEAEDDQKEMRKLQDSLLDLLAARTGQDRTFWEDTIRRQERWFSAPEALEAGLIDEVVTPATVVLL